MAKQILLLHIYRIGCGRRIQHYDDNRNSPTDTSNRWLRMPSHFRMSSIRQRRYHTSNICRMICDVDRIRNRLDI